MKNKLLGVTLTVGVLATSALAFMPGRANAFEMTAPPIDGAYYGDLLSLDVSFLQGDSAVLAANQAKISVVLNKLGSNASKDVRIRSFGFNLDPSIAQFFSFSPVNGYRARGNGTLSQRLAGVGSSVTNANFDYVFASESRSSARMSFDFIATLDDNDPNTIDRLFKTAFTKGARTNLSAGISGQAAASVIELDGYGNVAGRTTLAGEVPTPAMLPGLIGMGVAAIRKRRGSEEETAEA